MSIYDWHERLVEEELDGNRGRDDRRGVPGKVTLTSRLSGSGHAASAQAKITPVPATAPVEGAVPPEAVPAALPAVWATHGTDVEAAPAAKSKGKGGSDDDKEADSEGSVATGAVIGVIAGAIVGAVVGGAVGGGVGAVAGGLIGAVAGGLIGAGIGALAGGQSAATPAATPAGPAYAPSAVTPNFILDMKTDPRSNSKPSTQSASDPTCSGKAAVDSGAKVWRYQLDGVESKGKIRIVYFTEDHYPAPTPTDDSGALSNVTKDNWKAIVKDFDANKAGVPDFWSAYRAEDLHELYHWEKEWQGEVKKELVKAEAEISKLSLGFDKAATAPDAEAVLAAQAKKIFDDAMKRARAAYNALGDSAGDPPYQAQVPVIEALKKRVADHAAVQSW